jgi:hypothetical protein
LDDRRQSQFAGDPLDPKDEDEIAQRPTC